MDAPHPQGARVRWLVVGAFHPSPSGRRFALTEASFAEHLARAASGLSLSVEDRIGAGDASAYELTFDSLHAFQLARVIEAVPALRALLGAHAALSGARAPGPEEAAQLRSALGPGRLASAVAEALGDVRSAQDARRATLGVLEEAVFATARDLLRHPRVTRLESAWRGLHWLLEHCPPPAGMDVEVLDVGPEGLEEALARVLDEAPLQRPDACFVLETCEEPERLGRLAALGEQAWVPVVVAGPPSLLKDGKDDGKDGAPAEGSLEAWTRLRADPASRWLGAAVNPVVMMAEARGDVRRACFTSPALAVAALLSASFRDTRTFARLVGPGSGTRAPAVWQPKGRSTVATEVGLSLREQERLAAKGVLGVNGWWDSDAVLMTAAPTVYGGRDAVPLPAQLLTGRIVRLAQALAERIPPGATQDQVAAVFARAAEAFLATGAKHTCQLQARVVPTGNGGRGAHVRASLRPELAGRPVQLELTVPLRG